MDLWTFIVLVVVAGCLLQGYRAYLKSKSVSGDGRLDDLEARIAAVEGQGSLEERVRALEAIVTDPKTQLEREIADLKD